MITPTSWWERLARALTTFDPQPMDPPILPNLAGVDPLTRSIIVLRWNLYRSAFALSPDGTLLAVYRWACRIGLLLAIPLLLVLGLLFALNVALALLGGLLCSVLGFSIIFLGIVIVVIRLSR